VNGELVTRPLLASRLFVPRSRPGQVVRTRLLARLDESRAAKLTLLSAAPGFGKTTLLAEWARTPRDADRVAWISVDAGDDAGTFWSYVVAGLAAVLPQVSALRDLGWEGPPVSADDVTTLLNALAEAGDDIWIVLDDFHLLTDHDAREGVRTFVENLSANAHVVIATRQDPDLPLARLRARGDLVEVRAADLRFTRNEAAEYLRTATGVELASEDIDLLEGRTEGWIAALQLAALSLRGHADPRGFVERFAGDDRFVVDYLLDEVLAHQAEDVRDFLLRTAILDRLNGDLCDAVTGMSNGASMLLGIEKANLFLVTLDDQLRWFRYHHLFADVLRARLAAERPADVARLHDRASRWFEANGFGDDAIRHALSAREFERAGRLVETALPEARRERRDTALIGWLDELPESVVAGSPVLTVFRGWSHLVAGDLPAMEVSLDRADELLGAVPAGSPPPWPRTEELRTLPATIALYRASLAQARGDLAALASYAQIALAVAGPDDHFWLGGAYGFLALAAWSSGDVRPAIETFTAALRSLHAAGASVDELNSTALLAEMWTVAGRPDRAAELCRTALSAATSMGLRAARASADLHVALAELDLASGDLASAEEHLGLAAPLADREPNSESHHRRLVAAALLAQARGEPDRALDLLDEAQARYRAGYYPQVRPIAAVKARLQIASGDLDRARAWATESGVSTADEASYLREYEHLTLVQLLLTERGSRPGPADEALGLLHRLDAAASASGREGSLAEIRGLIAQAQTPTLASPTEATRPTSRGGAEPLTERELDVLRLLGSELSGPEIARHLFVSQNTLRTHIKHIFAKLDVTNRRAAVARGRESGIV